MVAGAVVDAGVALAVRVVGLVGWSWSALRLLAAAAPAGASSRVESGDEGVEAGCEPFVAVVEPDVFAEGDQGGEAVGRQ